MEDNLNIYLLLDYIKGGTLRDLIKSGVQLKEIQVRQIATQLLLSCSYLETQNIIHRDLKPENILLSFEDNHMNPDAFIADFGFAFKLKESQEKSVFGTPGYVAPEVLMGKPYSFKSDVFSVGSILYNIISGTSLFKGRSAQECLLKNMDCNVAEKIGNLSCTKLMKDFLRLILAKKPEQRSSSAEALQHQWFKDDIEAI